MTTDQPTTHAADLRITDEDVRVVAEQMLRRYESEYSAGHLTWLDFAVDARADLETAFRPGGLVARAVAAEFERIVACYPPSVVTLAEMQRALATTAAKWREGRR